MRQHRARAFQAVNTQPLETYWRIGQDIVEVIACSKPSELHKTLAQFAAKAEEQQPYQTLTRGMAVKGIDSAFNPQDRRWRAIALEAGFYGGEHISEKLKGSEEHFSNGKLEN